MSAHSTKSCYPSLYSPKCWVTASQFIVELICERRAQSLKKDLPINFWNLKEWANYYKYQIIICNQLIKNHDPKHIISALKNKSGRSIFSLRNPYLKKLIEIEESKPIKSIDENINNIIQELGINYVKTRKDFHSEPNIFEKIREIDGDNG